MSTTSVSSVSKEQRETAHMRFLDWNNHCTLTFQLQVAENDSYTAVDETVVAVRQMNESLSALLTHTENKVMKLLANHLKKEHDKENNVLASKDMKPALLNKSKEIAGATELVHLQKFRRMTFNILGRPYKVAINTPSVDAIRLPDVIYLGHAVQPEQFKATLVQHDKSLFSWYKSVDKEKWQAVGTEYHYKVKDDDINHYLKFRCVPVNVFGQGPEYDAVSNNPVCNVPEVPYCPFEDRQKETPSFLTGNEFRVVSYNTLSCRYSGGQYEYCSPEHLSIDYRKQLLLKEMIGYKADIVCCQEVDNKIYAHYFRPAFNKINFASIYNKKGNRIPEGVAIFYNKGRFSYLGHEQIVFNTEVKKNRHMRNIASILENDDEVNDAFMKQPSSMQYMMLKSRHSNQLIIVANTHLYYHPDANNVRLLQAAVSLEYLKGVYYKEIRKKNNMKVSLIFCGDFNSTPESDVYKFLTEGAIQYSSKTVGTSLFHPFHLKSACGTPQFTNYVDEFKACLDYIFTTLTCTKFVSLPAEEVLAKHVALPSPVFPSDHLALVADLKFDDGITNPNAKVIK